MFYSRTDIYNYIARLCGMAMYLCDRDVIAKYNCRTDDETENSKRIILGYVPELFDEERKPLQLTDEIIAGKLMPHLWKAEEHFMAFHNVFGLISMIKILDFCMHDLLCEEQKNFIEKEQGLMLNTNREETGVGLLPRTSCVWERTRRMSHRYNRLDNFLYNFLLINNKMAGDLKEKHIYFAPDFFGDFEKRKRIKIAATPLTIQSTGRPVEYVEDSVRYFKIDYDREKTESTNRLIWEKIIQAGADHSDIIVFPELMGNPATDEYIGDKIRKYGHPENLPALIILPSYYKEKNNIVTIMDRYGKIIAKQRKHNPYILRLNDKNCLEYINTSKEINIFHYEGIGRFAVLICKDFLDAVYLERLLRCFKLNFLIVPSYSTGSYDFMQSQELCANDDCNVVWLNTCAAYRADKALNFENIGYVRKRIAKYEDESLKLYKMKSCKGLFEGKCNMDCMFHTTIGEIKNGI